MNMGAMNFLQNNKGMMALVGENVCLGVPKYRSSIYNPDPRYDGGRGTPGCGLDNYYVPTGDALKCLKRTPNMNLYNMPKKGGNNLRLIDNVRQMKNEVSCKSYGDNDISAMYPHRDRATLHRNLVEPGCFQHKICTGTCFKCMDCGCRYTQSKISEMNSMRNPCQVSKNPVVVQVSCIPDSTVQNGQRTYLFRFNIQQKSCNKEKEPPNQKDFSSSVWWTCNMTDCQCQDKSSSATGDGFICNQNICTIPGKNGQSIPITCHYCFNFNEKNADQCKIVNTNTKCSKTGNTQKSLHGGSCICVMCERLRCQTRKRPNYYHQLNRGRGVPNTDTCSGNRPKDSRYHRVNPDHGLLCGCTDHQKCLNNLSSLNSQFGINCYPGQSTGGGCDENENPSSFTTDTENKCICLCHNVAPDDWQLDMDENMDSYDCDETEDNGNSITPPYLVRNC